jgi:hypothetical protein
MIHERKITDVPIKPALAGLTQAVEFNFGGTIEPHGND